jgi:hypothetical protein
VRARAALILAAALALGSPASAVAEEVTGAQLRDLAARAAGDPAALDRLRAIDRVDGRPVDLGRALGDDDAAAAARAAALAGSVGGAPPSGAPDARARAREVLRDGRYREASLPRPFRRPLRWLGDRVRPVFGAIVDAFEAVVERIPGGRLVAWLLLIAAISGAAVAISRVAMRRRAAAAAQAAAAPASDQDPAELERAAAAAERAGDWEAAVRLRFRAGIVRLDASTRTTGEVAEMLPSKEFEALGGRFDAIAYGGEAAGPDDAEQAREAWPRVLEDARR